MVSLAPLQDDVFARSPFNPECAASYDAWRTQKLSAYPHTLDEITVSIEDGFALTRAERVAILAAVGRANFAIYQLPPGAADDKAMLRALGRQLGLRRLDSNLCADEDGISSLRVAAQRSAGEYIPYTDKRLNWHTDGYYNSAENQLHGVILQCVRPAGRGGENAILDHEIAYIRLRDENPDYIRALMAADAMSIPANIQDGVRLRGEQTGPVFSLSASGHLHMRYSARTRNIVWKDDVVTRAAAQSLLNLFQQDSPYIFRHRLEAGQGFISNNVLHCRSAFDRKGDGGEARLLYRARYFDRISDIDPDR